MRAGGQRRVRAFGRSRWDAPGVFVPRAHATLKEPDTLTAWFGVDSGGTGGLRRDGRHADFGLQGGVALGDARFTARALDDRVGCTALLMALCEIDPAKLRTRSFSSGRSAKKWAWKERAAAAADFGLSVRRVHAIDTFVSSDSPLESPRFALRTARRRGAAFRALDNSSVTPPDEVARVVGMSHARAASHCRSARRTAATTAPRSCRGAQSTYRSAGRSGTAIRRPKLMDLHDIDALARMVADAGSWPTNGTERRTRRRHSWPPSLSLGASELMPIALLSVSDKTGLVEFATGWPVCKWKLVSTGGTAAALRDGRAAGPTSADLTGFAGDARRAREDAASGGARRDPRAARHAGAHARRFARPRHSDRSISWSSTCTRFANRGTPGCRAG